MYFCAWNFTVFIGNKRETRYAVNDKIWQVGHCTKLHVADVTRGSISTICIATYAVVAHRMKLTLL